MTASVIVLQQVSCTTTTAATTGSTPPPTRGLLTTMTAIWVSTAHTFNTSCAYSMQRPAHFTCMLICTHLHHHQSLSFSLFVYLSVFVSMLDVTLFIYFLALVVFFSRFFIAPDPALTSPNTTSYADTPVWWPPTHALLVNPDTPSKCAMNPTDSKFSTSSSQSCSWDSSVSIPTSYILHVYISRYGFQTTIWCHG